MKNAHENVKKPSSRNKAAPFLIKPYGEHLSGDISRADQLDKTALIKAIKNSGGKCCQEEVDDLWARLEVLIKTGRYKRLISSIKKANNKDNFLAFNLETNFAYQFESHGLKLAYEVKQAANDPTSIDFMRKTDTGECVYFELALLQQKQAITNSINNQMQESGSYSERINGEGEHGEVVRIQNTILGKVQGEKGKPIKFLSAHPDVVNVVAIYP